MDDRQAHCERLTRAMWDITRKDTRRSAKVFRDFYQTAQDFGEDPWALLDYATHFDPATNGLPRYLLTASTKDKRRRAWARVAKLVEKENSLGQTS